ncbi:unnamed protein product [Penicillium salamii]|nr:unnamed protein product [Penicillium salamii]CAG8428234.1 unnamed protein product [Penicillium salamii]
MYLSGVNSPDHHLLYEIDRQLLTLFTPVADAEQILWGGSTLTSDEALAKYDADVVLSSADIRATLKTIGERFKGVQSTVYTIEGHVEAGFAFPEEMSVNSVSLKEAIDECRVVKGEYEIALISKANAITCAAHEAVMKSVRSSHTEGEIEAVFLGECTRKGARIQANPSIVASGRAAATMHPEANNQSLYVDGTRKEVLLIDAGAEWDCYGADVTRTLPLSGKFSKEASEIYQIVLKMQEKCISVLKEEVLWDDVHLLTHRVAIEGLLSLGILKGDGWDIFHTRTSAAFLPHGIGHFLGMDTHDTGGRPEQSEGDHLFRYLRVRRNLPAGCVVTIEPDNSSYLKDPVHAKYIDEMVLDKYWKVGGICIEDDLLVTVGGSVNLTRLPKDLSAVEKIVSGGEMP